MSGFGYYDRGRYRQPLRKAPRQDYSSLLGTPPATTVLEEENLGDLDLLEGITEEAVISSLCRDSFSDFVKEFWDTIVPEKLKWNWHIGYLCDQMQEVAERVFRGEARPYDLVINVPPGTSKSTVVSILFVAWVWTRMPSARFICASYSFQPLALDLSRKCRDVLKSDKYRKCFPDIQLREDQDTKGYFANTAGGMRLAIGSGSTPIGFHAHFILIDDPIDPDAALSEAELKNVNEWMTGTLPFRKVDPLVTVTVLIMQRLHQDDPSGMLLSSAQQGKVRIKHICLPAELTERVNPPELRKFYEENGGLLDSVRRPRAYLDEVRRQPNGEYTYAGQFLQHPIPLGGGEFKTDRFQLRPAVPSGYRFKTKIRYWDKATTAGGGAFTVGVLMGLGEDGRIWVLNVVRGQWDTFKREQIIVQTAQADRQLYGDVRVAVEEEPGSGGKESAQATVARLHGFVVIVDRVRGSKEARAEPWSVQVNAGNVDILIAPWNYDYIEEHAFWPYSKYKDQVDGSSGCFSKLTQPRGRIGALR